MRKFVWLVGVVLLVGVSIVRAQDFMMQAYYWNYPKTADGYNWADTLIGQAQEIEDAGITFVSLPPLAHAHTGNSSNGYDPKDLFDYGEFDGAVGMGTRTDIDNLIDTLQNYSIKTVGDLVLNHRDGGAYENNSALETYNTNYDYSAGDRPYPYDRYRVILPVGGSTGHGDGDYYFKVKSRSGDSDFHDLQYSFYMVSNKLGDQGTSSDEGEPNGGGDCSQSSHAISLGDTINCTNSDYSGCWVDEFKLTLSSTNYYSGGDTLFIYFGKRNSNYSDMYVYGLWSSSENADIAGQLHYQTATKFSNLPSGRGDMDFEFFKPNSTRPSKLSGSRDSMLFYLDYDQYQGRTYDTLFNWAKWNWNGIGMRGFRMDAVKHYPPSFVGDLLDYLHDQTIDPSLVVGEYYSANTQELKTWIDSVNYFMDTDTKANITPRIYDFSLRDNLRQACDDASFDVRNIFASGVHDVEGVSGSNIITFVNNHDFRGQSGFESLIQSDPILAYAYILTNNQVGLPTIFYPDYFGYQGTESYYPSGADAEPHGDEIKKIIEIHKRHIYNASTIHYLNKSGSGYSNDLGTTNNRVLVYQLEKGPSNKAVIVAINFGSDTVKFHQQLDISNAISVSDTLTDIMGHSEYNEAIVKSQENGINNDMWIHLSPRNYAIWIQGANNAVIPLRPSGLKLDTISETAVTLSWTDNSMNESGFKVYATPKGGSPMLLTTTASNIVTYTYTGLSQDTEYSFQVKASNDKGDSESAKEVTDRTWVKWGGSTNATWATAANWESGNVVSAASKIIIPNVSNHPVITSVAVCKHLKIEIGGRLTINETHSLTVNGNLYNLAGNGGIIVKSSSTGTASLITLGEVGGGGTVERYFPKLSNGSSYYWYLVSPPITDATANVFFDEYLQYWDEVTEKYVSIEDETTPLHSGQGYANRKTQDQIETFEGKLATGNITAPVMSYHPRKTMDNITQDYSGWNLMGNPYPSAIDWNQITYPTGMGTSVSVWDESKSGGRGWYQYNGSDGSGDTQARYIGIAQGFFVLVNQDQVSLSFKNSDRTHTQASNFYKSSRAVSADLPQLKMTTSNHEYANSSYIVFKEDASHAVLLTEDCIKFYSDQVIPHVYSMVGAKNLAINEIPPPQQDDTVHIGFRVSVAGSYQLTFSGIQNINADWPLYLRDNINGHVYDLRQDSVVMFNYQNSDSENRFDLFFDEMTISKDYIQSGPITIFSYGEYVYVHAIKQSLRARIRIFNILGQEVYVSEDVTSFTNGKKLNLPSATYLVEVCSDHNCTTKKIHLE